MASKPLFYTLLKVLPKNKVFKLEEHLEPAGMSPTTRRQGKRKQRPSLEKSSSPERSPSGPSRETTPLSVRSTGTSPSPEKSASPEKTASPSPEQRPSRGRGRPRKAKESLGTSSHEHDSTMERPPKRIKDNLCTCFQPHDSIIECREEEKHRDISILRSKIVCCSPAITLYIGPEKQRFDVYRDLIILHSQYLDYRIRDATGKDVIVMDMIKPALFMDFVSWINTGNFLSADSTTLGITVPCAELWQMGSLLQAPYFQNFCFDHYRKWCKENADKWPSISIIRDIYKLTSKDSLFRKFAEDSMISKNPLDTLQYGSEEHKDWTDLIKEVPELAVAIVTGPKSWGKTYPWEDTHRNRYLVEEVSLEERWDIGILRRRKKEVIRGDAANGCCQSQIELAHLERETRSVDHGGSAAPPPTPGTREMMRISSLVEDT